MASVTEKVKESLVGVDDEPQLSSTTRTMFHKHAVEDPETAQRYMTEKEFVDAIAPASEDYVSINAGIVTLDQHLQHIRPVKLSRILTVVFSTKSSASNMPSSSPSPTATTRSA